MMRTFLMMAALLGAPVAAAPVHKPVKARVPVRHAAVRTDWSRVVAPTPEGGYRMGNPAAAVKLVEYGARTCPTCALFDVEGLPVLKAKYIASGGVSYEFRDYPVHGAIDLGPILLGRCVSPAQYFPLLDDMMHNQRTLIGREQRIPAADQEKLSHAPPNEVARYLAKFYGYSDLVMKHGMSAARANACLADRKAVEAIAKRADTANAAGLKGTPGFFVNGKFADGTYTWAALEPVLIAAIPK